MKKIYRIPTILGLLVLLVGIGVGVVLVRQGPTWFIRAGPETTPKQVKITNITENTITVSWITDGETSGYVKYGTGEDLSSTAGDDRDELAGTGKIGSYSTHHVTLKNLKPVIAYSFKIGSGSKLFDNNGQAYQATTAPVIQSALPPNDIVYGTVVDQNNNPVEGAIVLLSLANTAPLSTLTKASGSWVIPLNLARSSDLTAYATYDPLASIEEIFIQAGLAGTATAMTTTKNDSPVPTITLGRSFDFRAQAPASLPEEPEGETPVTPTATPTPLLASGFNLPEAATPSAATGSAQLTILNPDQGERINTQKPEFLGRGPAGKTIKIVVNSSKTVSDQVTVNSDGTWDWTPPSDLPPGEHTITASLADGTVVKRTFTVLAAGASNLPAFTATPSGKIITPTPTATYSGRTSIPATSGGVPTSGFLAPTFFVFLIGIGFIFLGLITQMIK